LKNVKFIKMRARCSMGLENSEIIGFKHFGFLSNTKICFDKFIIEWLPVILSVTQKNFFRSNIQLCAPISESLLQHLLKHLRILSLNDDENATSTGLVLTFTSNQLQYEANASFFETVANQILNRW